ncbi:MAG: neutral zinc metallopeptidase, partial [Gammaproteobacteria bacterium]|nr:neutral zinc metallopeptidase [Gammaproteobacteria bacterium]
MKWRSGRRSSNVEDRRGQSPRGKGIRLGGGATIAVIVIGLFLGVDPMQMLNMLGNIESSPTTTSSQPAPKNDEQAQFVSVVLADTEDVWNKLFKAGGERYSEPGLVLFTGRVSSACGMQSSATGPFYCPGDRKVYIDLSFYRQLAQMGGAGDFARAYVIGHEVGHHVQNLLGTSTAVHKKRQSLSKKQGNALSVLQELQADCYAGVWAHHAEKDRNLLEEGDVEEGLAAAAAIGDDALQKGTGRSVRPESFTHGSSAQRVKWLKRGLRSG